MVQYWLNNLPDLFSVENIKGTPNHTKIMNVISLILIIVFITVYINTKDIKYLVYLVISIGSLSILHYSQPKQLINNVKESFTNNLLDNLLNNFKQIELTANANEGDSYIIINNNKFKSGDIIVIKDDKYIIDSLNEMEDSSNIIIELKPNVKHNYPSGTVVNNYHPNSTGTKSNFDEIIGDDFGEKTNKFVLNGLNYNQREDRDYEMSTMGLTSPTTNTMYRFQGPPNGPLECRSSTTLNPAGTINVTEYDSSPTMYGTCVNDPEMVINNESLVSQRIDDLLFHKGNSQMTYLPVPGDTLPNNQEAFANWCYSGNRLNPKYASVFVNDPDKYKLVAANAQATGTENGGGGGGGGRP